jgi:regulator of protease activity HflC (stomatin/prohibitin superfamily)
MFLITFISVFVAACLAWIAWDRWVTTVVIQQHEAALLFRHGKLVRPLAAGRHRIFGSGHEVKRFDARRTDFQVAGQEFLTADKAGLKVSAVVEYHVVDPVIFIGAAVNPL